MPLARRLICRFLLLMPLLCGLSACVRSPKIPSPAEIREKLALHLPTQRSSCDFASATSCRPEEICAYTSPDRASCVPRYAGSTPFVRFPFAPDTPVVCSQGTRQKGSLHGFESAQYALDLGTPATQKVPATIHAAREGTAFVFQSCPDSQSEAGQKCGDGLGNHVRILDTDGYLVLYAHMGSIWLQDGQRVSVGDPIGREGRDAKEAGEGAKHIHFSVHYAPIQKSFLETMSYYRDHPHYVPPSIPFELQYCDPADTRACLRKRSRMDEIPCGKTPPVLLRADWREG